MKQTLLYLDIFPQEAKLYFGNSDSHRSLFGAFFSILIFATSIFFSYYFGIDVIERQYPNVIRSAGEVLVPPIIDLNAENLPVMIAVLDHLTQVPFQDEQAFTIVILMMSTQRITGPDGKPQIDTQFEQFQSETCVQSKHIKNQALDEVIAQNDITQFYCIPYNLHKFQFGGSWDLGESYALFVELQRCDRTQKECYDDAKIDKILASGYINVYFPMFNINPSLPNPIIKYSKASWTGISNLYKQTIILQFKEVNLQIDKGFLLEDIQKSTEIGFSNYREFSDNLQGNSILRIAFMVDTTYQTVSLKYKQVQQVIAQIGGFTSIILMVVGFIVSRYQEIDFQKVVINDVFNWKQRIYYDQNSSNSGKNGYNNTINIKMDQKKGIIDNQSKQLNQLETSVVRISKKSDLERLDIVSNGEASMKETNFEYHQTQLKKNYENYDDIELQLTDKDQLKLFSGLNCDKTLQNLYGIAEQEIKGKINFINILKKLDEIEIIKHILLNDDQLNLLEKVKQKQFIYIADREQHINQCQNLPRSTFRQHIIFTKNDKELQEVHQQKFKNDKISQFLEQRKNENNTPGSKQDFENNITQKILQIIDVSQKSTSPPVSEIINKTVSFQSMEGEVIE